MMISHLSDSRTPSCIIEWFFNRDMVGSLHHNPVHQSSPFYMATLDDYEFFFMIDCSDEFVTIAVGRSDMKHCPIDIAGSSVTFCGVTRVFPPNSIVDQFVLSLNDFISVNDTESLLKNGHDVCIIGRVFARQVSSDTEKWEGIGMVGGGAGSWMAEMAA
jgi:hypothetical protein